MSWIRMTLLIGLVLPACSTAPPADDDTSASATGADETRVDEQNLPGGQCRRGDLDENEPRGPSGPEAIPTTDGEIYLRNLESQLKSATRQVERQPNSAIAHRTLSSLHYERALLRADLDEIQTAIDAASKALDLQPKSPDTWLLRARQNQSLHRYEQARRDLEQAKEVGLAAHRAASVERELEWNQGNYESAISAIRAAVDRNETPVNVARLALLEHDLGHIARARQLFADAESLVVDTSPFTVAWIDLQRGVQAVESGDLELAVAFFRDAVERLPSYIVAREHLAETLHLMGRDAKAAEQYEAVLEDSNNPQFMAALASVYRSQGRVQRADQLVEEASTRFDELLSRYPKAVYRHAATFYAEHADDTGRAVELLRDNVELRPNAGSYTALANALLEDEQPDAAAEAIEHALEAPVASAQIFWTAGKIYARRDMTDVADRYAERARRCSPAIETIEGPLTSNRVSLLQSL